MSNSGNYLWAVRPEDYRVGVVSDGTCTVAEIIVIHLDGRGRVVGRGVARRRKGDPRNNALGEILALQRAFEDAAREMKRHADLRLSL